MSESKEVQYAVGKENVLIQLMKNFGRQKRVVMKYNEGYKYVHIYDNRKVEKKNILGSRLDTTSFYSCMR